eukprot:5041527-Pleurochrysis_carterae.AAC.1
MLCAKVWFPIVNSNCRTFCNEQCLFGFNADDCKSESDPLPVRRRDAEWEKEYMTRPEGVP